MEYLLSWQAVTLMNDAAQQQKR